MPFTTRRIVRRISVPAKSDGSPVKSEEVPWVLSTITGVS